MLNLYDFELDFPDFSLFFLLPVAQYGDVNGLPDPYQQHHYMNSQQPQQQQIYGNQQQYEQESQDDPDSGRNRRVIREIIV